MARKTPGINNFDKYLIKKDCFNYNLYMNTNFSEIIFDKIINFNYLNQELGCVFKKIGIPFNGKLSVRSKNNYKGIRSRKKFRLTNEQIEKIKVKYSKEINLMNFCNDEIF